MIPTHLRNVCVLAAFLCSVPSPAGALVPACIAQDQAKSKPQDIASLLEPIRTQHHAPALAAAAVRGSELIAIGVTGVRKFRAETPATIDDLFHIGSCTKSMTATVAAMLVEDGELSWDTTIAEALPELADAMHEQYRDVTLRMLLLHRSGMIEDRAPDPQFWQAINQLKGPIHQQRLDAAALALARQPVAAPGEVMHYSNFGYVVAGAMMEHVTGETWEQLMRTRLFEPLGMTSAGFGPPGAGDEIDANAPAQPWGHIGQAERLAAIRPGPFADNPPLLGPAGTVHCTLTDLAKYASFHLTRGAKTGLLPAAAFDTLHTPVQGDYALGWGVAERPWADGRTLTHTGSNGMWFATIWLAPERSTGYIAVCNLGGDAGARATDLAVSALITGLPDAAAAVDDD